MATKKRVYVVVEPTGVVHLVRAYAPIKARNYVCKLDYEVRLATHDELIELIGKGVEVEDGTKEEDGE